MDFNETFRQRVEELLLRSGAVLTETRTMSRSERVVHTSELLGFLHALTSIEGDLAHAPAEWEAARTAVGETIDLLGERLRILSEPDRGAAAG